MPVLFRSKSAVFSTSDTGPTVPRPHLVLLCATLFLTNTFSSASAQEAVSSNAQIIELPAIDVFGVNEQTPIGADTGFVATHNKTATKTDTPIAKTPQAINVVTQDQLQQQQPQNIGQALRYTPGVTSEIYGTDSTNNWLQIRGFNAYDAIYLDGLQTDNGSLWTYQLEPYGIERLEILKGPSSMLYGQNEPGGLVNAISKRPTNTPQHEITLQTGSYNQKQLGVDSSGPVPGTSGTLDYRIVAMTRQSNAMVNDTENNRQYVAPSLTWKPNADTSFTLLANYLHVSIPGWTGAYLPVEGTLYGNPNGQISRSTFPGVPGFDKYQTDQAGIGWELVHQFSNAVKFTQNVRYNHVNGFTQNAYDIGLQADSGTLDRATFASKTQINSVNFDNHIQYNVATGPLQHQILVGVDVRHQNADYSYAAGSASSIDIYNPGVGDNTAGPLGVYQAGSQHLNQLGAYVQDQMVLGSWQLTTGVRHDNVRTSNLETLSGTRTDQDDSAWTYRGALLYAFDNGIAPYLSYTTSFLPNSGTSYESNPFKPTRGRQYEAGLKYKPVGYKALFTAALFNLDQTNVLTTDPEHAYYNVQTGQVRSRGLELEAKVSLLSGLDLNAAYTYDQAVIVNDTENAGNAMPTAPRHNASLWGHYQIQSGVAQGLGVGAGVRYRSSYYGDNANLYQLPSVTLVDAMLDYDLGKFNPALTGLNLQINASNLFNKTYVSDCFIFGAASCVYGSGRTVYATLSYRW